MKTFTYLTDLLKLLIIIMFDHCRSVPRKTNLNLFKIYLKLWWNEKLPRNMNYSSYQKKDLLEIYHQMITTIWELFWETPRMHFHSYQLRKIDYSSQDDQHVPSIHYLRFDCQNHVYFLSFKIMRYANSSQVDRTMDSVDTIYNEFDYPNSSLIFITTTNAIETLRLEEEFPEALFDTPKLEKLKEYHYQRVLGSLKKKQKIYCNTNTPGTIITYWTWEWVFNLLLKKFQNAYFYLEEDVFDHFHDRMYQDYADTFERARWEKIKPQFRTYSKQDNYELEFFDLNIAEKNKNPKFQSAEHCVRGEGSYLLSIQSKKTLKFIRNSKVPLPCIYFPSKGCLKNSNEDHFVIGKMSWYQRYWLVLKHNFEMLLFIYFD